MKMKDDLSLWLVVPKGHEDLTQILIASDVVESRQKALRQEEVRNIVDVGNVPLISKNMTAVFAALGYELIIVRKDILH